MKALVYAIAGVLLGVAIATLLMRDEPTAQTEETPTQTVVEPVEKPTLSVEELFELTNAERAKAGVKPLELDERLNKSAQRKADELQEEGWNDDNPHINDAGVNTADYIFDTQDKCSRGSENLTTAPTSEYALANWKASQPHYEAMISEQYESTGFAINGIYVVQHFCDLD